MFTPLRTQRLLIRPVVPADAEALHARRNEPEVARLQAWQLPWPRDRADRVIAESAALGEPTDGQWWMATLEELSSGATVGDVVLNLSNECRTGEVGYSLATPWWGRGYATEALGALVDWVLAAHPVSRLAGNLHPDNRASAMVLERTGFLFEGHTRLSFWLGDDNSDDWIYGLTRTDRQAWLDRPRTAPDEVRLVPITSTNKAAVLGLRTHHSQRAFVDPMPESFADALVPDQWEGAPLTPWLRAVEADGTIVGFVMLALASGSLPDPYLWRLLVDRLHQDRGIGRRVVDLVADECRSSGNRALLTSWVEGKGSPAPFYARCGFLPTGRVVHGETEGRLALGSDA